MMERTHVAIIGAGITGLALGYHLSRLGVPHVVLEAEDRAGGVIRSGEIEGRLLEWGPQRTRLTAALEELVREIGLDHELITAAPGLPLYVYRAAKLRLVPFSPGAFLRSNIVPFRAKVRLALEPFTTGPDPTESVAHFFTRKVGKSVYDSLLGPLYGGLYASDPADMVVGLSLGRVLEEFGVGRSLLLPLLRRGGRIDPPLACSFRYGMESLPAALYRANSANVWLSTPALGLSRGDAWTIRCAAGDVQASRVVVTTSAGAAAKLLEPVDPRAASALRGLVYNPLAVVHLHADADLHGLGYQVALSERLATRGVTFTDSLFQRDGVYTAYLGGSRAPGVIDWADAEIAAVAVREFRQVTGAIATSLSVAREWMPAWDTSWTAISSLAPPEGIHFAANWESRPGIPGRLAQARRLAGSFAAELLGNPQGPNTTRTSA